MKNNFVCPYCVGYLNVSDKIVITARRRNGSMGLLFLNPELGNYSVERNENFEITDGESVDLICPICHSKLNSNPANENLASILMFDHSGEKMQIIISRIAGEHSTYKVSKGIVESYGDHSHNYIDFDNLIFMK